MLRLLYKYINYCDFCKRKFENGSFFGLQHFYCMLIKIQFFTGTILLRLAKLLQMCSLYLEEIK